MTAAQSLNAALTCSVGPRDGEVEWRLPENRAARPLVSSQPPTVAGSPAYGREPSRVSQTSTLRVWEANGGMAYNGAPSEVSFSASKVFPSAAFTAGSSARSVDNVALPPIEDGNATYPA